jgi:hypothetical protein
MESRFGRDFSSVRIHAETPSPHQVCDETRPLGTICR